MRKYILILSTAVFFVTLIIAGLALSSHKPLWNDEIYTAHETIPAVTYKEILQGKIIETNNFPLYYVIQKATMDINKFELTRKWDYEHFMFHEKGQKITRIPSIFFVAFTLSFMLFFFLKNNDTFSAIVSMLLISSVFMTWGFWIEARPYALWYSLSIIHGLLLLKTFSEKKPKNTTALLITHWLLGLTSFVSIIQIILANVLIFAKTRNLKKTLLLSSPLVVIFFYKSTGMPIIPWIDAIKPAALLLTSIPLEWLALIVATILFAFIKKQAPSQSEIFLFIFFLGIFAVVSGTIFLAWTQQKPKTSAPMLHYRHFIFATPYAMLFITHILKGLWVRCQNHLWSKINIILLILGLVITSGIRTATLLHENIIFLFK